MNFFGHATVANWQSSSSRFILGAMLPDFAAMCGNPIREVFDEEIRFGIELHKTTDEIFHRNGVFVELCASATKTLSARGLKRASARALGHVGIELMLDGTLSSDRRMVSAYLRALTTGDSDHIANQIRWRYTWRNIDWRRLLAILRSANIPQGYRDTPFLVERLANILAPRPNLALTSLEDLAVIADWVRQTQPKVDARASEIIETLRGAIKY
jgi:acyl carrier protein phosphodiesterase